MAVLWLQGSRPDIPEISDERLHALAARIKPVVSSPDDGPLFRIEDCDLRREAFTWDPKLTTVVDAAREIAIIETIHSCGYYGFFKPTIAEVLAQIPEHLIERVHYFETLKGDSIGVYRDGNGHRSATILYEDIPKEDLHD